MKNSKTKIYNTAYKREYRARMSFFQNQNQTQTQTESKKKSKVNINRNKFFHFQTNI